MKVSPQYKKGYIDGVKAGQKHGTYVVKHDLIGVYGAMALCLQQRGWKTDTILKLMKQIQNKWNDVCESDNSMVVEVQEKLGFDIEQMMVEVQ